MGSSDQRSSRGAWLTDFLKHVQLPSLIVAEGADPTQQRDVDDLDLDRAERPCPGTVKDAAQGSLHSTYRAHDSLPVQAHGRMEHRQEPQALLCLASRQLFQALPVVLAQHVRMTLRDLIVQEGLRLAAAPPRLRRVRLCDPRLGRMTARSLSRSWAPPRLSSSKARAMPLSVGQTQWMAVCSKDEKRQSRARLWKSMRRDVSLMGDILGSPKDPSYVLTVQRRVKSEEGTRRLVETQRLVCPWWRTDVTGAIILTVRYGFKHIEFEKGKAGIAVPAKEKLVSVIETMIAAVRAGELDEMLARQGRARGAPKAKRAA